MLNFPSTPPPKIKKKLEIKRWSKSVPVLFFPFPLQIFRFRNERSVMVMDSRLLYWKRFSLFIWLGSYFPRQLSFSSFLSFNCVFFSTKSWQFLSLPYQLRYPKSTIHKANPIFWCPSRDHPIKVTAHVHCVMLPLVEFCAMRPETFSSFSASKLVLSIHKCKIPWFKST